MDKNKFKTTSKSLLDVLFKEVVEEDEYMLTSITRPIDYFIDIGANIGVTTLFALENLDIRKAVIALEPQEDNFKCLEENIKHLYNGDTEVVLLNKALGNGMPVSITKNPKNKGMYRTIFSSNAENTIATISLSDLILDRCIHIQDSVVLKCDCEGGEVHLMNPLEELLLGTFYQICFELHYGEQFFEDCPSKNEYQCWVNSMKDFKCLYENWQSDKNGKVILRSRYA